MGDEKKTVSFDKSPADEGMASAMTRNQMIRRTYENPPTDELMTVYSEWAKSYDSDLIEGHGYKAPEDAVAQFCNLDLAADARILDCGCGTGIVGELLNKAGFTNIDGADLSDDMREIAAGLGVYKRLFGLDMTADYNIAAKDAYDAVICVGVFGFGPPHVEHIHHIMGAAKPGAPILMTVNASGWLVRGWDQTFAPHLAEHGITLVRDTPIRHMIKDGIGAHLIELRRG
jgi:predicted TPR repeat methyltransferase